GDRKTDVVVSELAENVVLEELDPPGTTLNVGHKDFVNPSNLVRIRCVFRCKEIVESNRLHRLADTSVVDGAFPLVVGALRVVVKVTVDPTAVESRKRLGREVNLEKVAEKELGGIGIERAGATGRRDVFVHAVTLPAARELQQDFVLAKG